MPERNSNAAVFRRAASVALLIHGLAVAPAFAASFSKLVIFGDSLSDIGNVAQATNSFYPLVPRTPGQYYYSGRFSNGPVYGEALAHGLGLPPLVRSRAGGDNFAHGGAEITGTTGLTTLVIRDVEVQIDEFIDSRAPDPNALYVIFAGANDMLGSDDVGTTIDSLQVALESLVVDGARNLLVMNLPLLADTPRYNQGGSAPDSTSFNMALSTMLDEVALSYPAASILRFDTARMFELAVDHPQWFGMVNVTHAAAPGLEPGDSSYNTSLIATNVNQYLFWDDLHPTTAAHAILAERLLIAIHEPGDFNRDGESDAADYVLWRKDAGAYMPPDENDWLAAYGGDGGTGSNADSVPVPEPSSMGLLHCACCIVPVGRRRRTSRL